MSQTLKQILRQMAAEKAQAEPARQPLPVCGCASSWKLPRTRRDERTGKRVCCRCGGLRVRAPRLSEEQTAERRAEMAAEDYIAGFCDYYD